MVVRFTLLTSLFLLASVPLVLAHKGATGVVKERMDLMKRQKDDMKVIGLMAKGKTPFDASKAAEAARDIEITAKEIHELFPEGTIGHPSEAKAAIWSKWDSFTDDADALEASAKALAAALENGVPGWKSDFQAVTNACKACHKTFRAKK